MKSPKSNSAGIYAVLLCAVIFSVGACTHAGPVKGTESQSTIKHIEAKTFDTIVSPFIYTPPVEVSSIEPIQNLSDPQVVQDSFWIDVPDRAPVLSNDAKMTINTTGEMRTYKCKPWDFKENRISSKAAVSLSEKYLFFRELYHPSSNPNQSWRLRVGKGGQIYSVLQNVEVITNSREYIGNQGQTLNRWIDRVIQSVVIPGEVQNPEWKNTYRHVSMMHQAGSRLDDVLADYKVQYFNPILGYEYQETDPHGGSSLNMVQLLFVNQKTVPLKSTREYVPMPLHIHPKVLHWTYIRDLGEGAFERVVIVHNFGKKYVYSFCDMWTGFVQFEPAWRNPVQYDVPMDSRVIPIITKPTGAWYAGERGGGYVRGPGYFSHTGGWAALVSQAVPGTLPPDWTVKDDGLGIGYVFGTQELQPNDARFVYGINDGEWQDLTIMTTTVNRKGRIEPGETWYSKHYFILDDFGGIRKTAERLKSFATYGKIKPYSMDGSDHGAGTLSLNRYGSEVSYPDLGLWDRPIKNGAPIFTIYDRQAGQFLLTDDPYILSDRPMDGRTLFVRLNGFARKVYKGDSIPADQVSLCSQIPASSYREGDHEDYSLYASIGARQ